MKKERIFWGLFFLLAAVLVILNRFSLFAEISLIRLLVTIALVIWLLQSIIHRSMTGILFSIAFLLMDTSCCRKQGRLKQQPCPCVPRGRRRQTRRPRPGRQPRRRLRTRRAGPCRP